MLDDAQRCDMEEGLTVFMVATEKLSRTVRDIMVVGRKSLRAQDEGLD